MTIDFAVRDHVATVVLNRPGAMNAIDLEMRRELFACWKRIQDDQAIRVAIVTGAGDRAFSTGADLKKTMPPKESFAQLNFGAGDQSIGKLATDKPLICAINGYALAGGLELALACDIRIASDNARFGLTEVRIGSIPGAGGTQRLPRVVGSSNAMMMMLTGEQIDAAEALRIGLISRVVPREALREEADQIARKIAANAPLCVRAVKKLVVQGQGMPLDAAIDMERYAWGVLRDTEDRIEGRRAFQEKRSPVFQGR